MNCSLFVILLVVMCVSKVTNIIVADMQTGEVLVDKTIYGARSKGGWCMVYQQRGLELIATAPSPAVLKVFMYLAMGQTFEGGMKTTKAFVQKELGMSKPTVINAFNWLKENFIVHEWRVDGCAEFMINPQYVCIGKFDERMKLWNERFENFKPMYVSASYSRAKQKLAELSRADKKTSSAS